MRRYLFFVFLIFLIGCADKEQGDAHFYSRIDQGHVDIENYEKTKPKTCRDADRMWTIAAGFNWANQRDNISLDMSLLDLDPGTRHHAFHIFDREYLDLVNSWENLASLNPDGIILVNLVSELDRLQIICTDMPNSQGGLGSRGISWNFADRELITEFKHLYGPDNHLFSQILSANECI